MKRAIFAATFLAASIAASAAAASPYCDGFAAGWQSAFENAGKMVAMTPMCGMAPMGQDTFQGGYQAGLLAALRYMSSR